MKRMHTAVGSVEATQQRMLADRNRDVLERARQHVEEAMRHGCGRPPLSASANSCTDGSAHPHRSGAS